MSRLTSLLCVFTVHSGSGPAYTYTNFKENKKMEDNRGREAERPKEIPNSG